MLDRQNLTAVQFGILGGMLMNPGKVGEVCAKLEPELFDTIATRGLYDAISALHFEGAPIDKVTVQRKAGSDYAVALDEALKAAAANDLDYYCDMLKEYSRLSKIQLLGVQLSGASSLEEADKLIDEINGIVCGRSETETVDALELIMQFVSRRGDPVKKPEYITFGMEQLDKNTYVEKGDFVVVGGYSSAGKTLLSLQFALNMAKKYRVGYFSLETNSAKLGERLIAHSAKITLSSIKRRDNSDDEYQRAIQVGSAMGAYKGCLKFHQAAGMNVRDIQALTLSNRYEIIFVDYLQIVEAAGRDLYDKVTSVSKALHTLAQRHKVTVVALAQLARPEKQKGKPVPPSMWSFKESGQIENDADVAMLLYPNDPDDNRSTRHLKVSKNKDGEKCEFDLAFNGAMQTLTPIKPSLAKQIAEAKAAEKERERQMSFEEITEPDKNLPF